MLSKRWLRAALIAFGGTSNVVTGLAFGLLDLGWRVPLWAALYVFIGGLCALAYALRELLFRTQYRFEEGYFVCTEGPLSLRPGLKLPLSEIEGFITAPRGLAQGQVLVRLRNGETRKVHTPLDDARWVLTNDPTGPYVFLAAWLNDACDKAQHEGGEYRIAPGQATHQPEADESSDLRADRTQHLSR